VHQIFIIIVVVVVVMIVGRENTVSIATCYGRDWKPQGTNPGGGGGVIFSTPNWPWGPPCLLYNGYRFSPGGKAAGGVALTTHHYLAPRLKKE